eukprot:2629588-Prymnesium_polylepis.2
MALLPPSSSETFLMCCAAAPITFIPDASLPVNATLSIPAWLARAAPTAPAPTRMLNTPGGTPASCAIAARWSAERGVFSEGLRISEQPAASAGATFHAAISSG